jgi:hypothetical protein
VILPVRQTLRDDIQLVDGIRGGLCPVAVVNPLVVCAVRTVLKMARFLPSGSGFLDGEGAVVVLVSVSCACRKVNRVGIISSLAPSEW